MLSDFWATRPRRPRQDRKVAGVAAAIAQRYGIDPVLVRVVFAVTGFYGGAGLLLYLLGWLLLPEEDAEVSPAESLAGKGTSGTSGTTALLLVLALIPVSGFLIKSDGAGPIALATALAGLYLLHRHRGAHGLPSGRTGGDTGRTGATATDDTTAATTETTGTSVGVENLTRPVDTPSHPAQPTQRAREAEEATEPAAPQPSTPPAWDPLGVAPFAWDLPDPAPRPEAAAPAPRRRSRVTPITLGLALVTAGTALAAASAVPWLGMPHVLGLTLAVVALGLVVGAFRRGGRGLIVVAIPLGLATVAATALPFTGNWQGMGDRTWRATSAAEVKPTYELGVGNALLDLRDLQLGPTDVVHSEVHLDTGNVEVRLPSDLDVQVRCVTHIGHMVCLQTQEGGFDLQTVVKDDGADGPGGGKLVLDLRVGLGNVEVYRD